MKIGESTDIRNFWYGTALTKRIMNNLSQSLKLSSSKQATFRLQAIEFHQQYGISATTDAYGISRATFYRWRRRYLDSHKNLHSLVPRSRRPHNLRSMSTDYRIVEFIRKLRVERGRIGKQKIKPLLDEYCYKVSVPCISESLIGKIIKRKNLSYYSPSRRVYHNPEKQRWRLERTYKHKVKKSPKPEHFGYIEIDTIHKFVNGIRSYIFNAIDVKLRFQFSYAYKKNSSRSARDFYTKLEKVYPIKNGIREVQTDNGSEFLGEFDEYLRKKKIKHRFIYPRCPRINGHVERANRSLQEEFVNRREDLLLEEELHEFNRELMEHLIWYNTKRIHQGIKNQTPIDYLLQHVPESHMYVTRTQHSLHQSNSL